MFVFDISKLSSNTQRGEYGFGGSNGKWDLYKCFYRNGKDYVEFFINLNFTDGKGEITYKDKSLYGKTLIKHLTQELV